MRISELSSLRGKRSRLPRWIALGLLGLAVMSSAATENSAPLYGDFAAPLEARVDDLLARLTLEEKVALVHADSKFSSAGVPRLGFPRLAMSDGPHGVREEIGPDSWEPAGRTDDFCTYLPVTIGLAATWNRELARAYGETLAEEARARGKDVLLGPGLGIVRTPLCGRNFESLGEDPWLAAELGVAYIRGLQSRGVAACAKPLVANNQERFRHGIDVEIEERALREIHLLPFEAAVREAGSLAIMGAYNRLRGQAACHHEELLNGILKQEWGFRGAVISDWGGTHDTREAALYGLDIEMGTSSPDYDGYFLGRAFREAIQRGEIPVAVLDDKVRRVLRVALSVDRRQPGAINSAAHQELALRVAEESFVLLKNEGDVLPLDPQRAGTIAIIGENAIRLQAHSGGSSEVKAFYEITPLEGLVRAAGGTRSVSFSLGYKAPATRRLEGFDVAGMRNFETEKIASPDTETWIEQAVAAAKQAEAVIIVAGLNHDFGQEREGTDRSMLELPWRQPELIARVAAVNPRTVVVLMTGSAVTMEPWLNAVPAVLLVGYPGMEGGAAIANVLFGKVNPSGKLPYTFPKRLADSPAHADNDPRRYPGVEGKVWYEEGLLLGYRWFDAEKIEPLFPFGHGLSYTRFSYGPLRVVAGEGATLATVEVDVTNAGERGGAEVVQLYVQDEAASVVRPPRELKAFAKVTLAPGETKTVSLPLTQRSLAFYSVERRAWVAEAGAFALYAGSSSRDVRAQGQFSLAHTLVSTAWSTPD